MRKERRCWVASVGLPLSSTAYNGSSSGLWEWDEDPRPCLKMGPLRLSLRCGYLLPEDKSM